MTPGAINAALQAHWSSLWHERVCRLAGWLQLVGLGRTVDPLLTWLERRQARFVWPLLERAAIDKARGVGHA